MTGFYTTPLDGNLRNLGITTVILTDVSANITGNRTPIDESGLPSHRGKRWHRR